MIANLPARAARKNLSKSAWLWAFGFGPLRASFEDPTPRAYLGKPEVDEYLSQHGIQAWLAEAVNAAVLARSPNPRKFIATWLAERTALG